jgi:hypothetical protein
MSVEWTYRRATPSNVHHHRSTINGRGGAVDITYRKFTIKPQFITYNIDKDFKFAVFLCSSCVTNVLGDT